MRQTDDDICLTWKIFLKPNKFLPVINIGLFGFVQVECKQIELKRYLSYIYYFLDFEIRNRFG
jgi:hypothetical protein